MIRGSAYNSMMENLSTLPSSRYVVTDNTCLWNDAVLQRLNQLVSLKVGWDGYQAQPVSFENAYFAMQMLYKICGHHSPAPQIVPGTSGDLQLEWHTMLGDLELHVVGPNHVIATYCKNLEDSEEIEQVFTFDFTEVVNWLSELETPIAVVPAAA